MTPVNAAPLLGVYGIQYEYGNQCVLEEVSFELERGKILSLIGPNGCGKSTLLKIIAGILPVSVGQVRYLGQDLRGLSVSLRARRVAYLPPEIRADFPITAEEAVTFGRICHSSSNQMQMSSVNQIVRIAMERCRCWGLRHQWLHTLSGGERQLVALARAIAQESKILLLDEALSRMDLNHQAWMGQLLREQAEKGCSVILVSHDLNLGSEWSDQSLLLHQGKVIVFGPTQKVLTLDNILKLYPGAPLILGTHPTSGAPKVFFSAITGS